MNFTEKRFSGPLCALSSFFTNSPLSPICPFSRTSPGESDSCHQMTRKKRRGVIEKKRRDRINLSLCELKRLVPSAYEKQGSAKLEKAEILQLTVDHLKTMKGKSRYTRYNLNYGCLEKCKRDEKGRDENTGRDRGYNPND